MNILIVDDDEIARMSLGNILGGLGKIVEAADGEQAWRLLLDGLRPAVCCCDIMMPRLDGLGLLQRVRAHTVLRELPFVLISSASDRQTVQNAIASGVAGYVLKPFLGVQTRATVERVLRERREADAEHVQVTRRRLSIGLDQLRKLLHKLEGDVRQATTTLLDEAASAEAQAAWLQRLHSGCLVLGLWRGAALLKEALADGPGSDTGPRQQALQELERLVAQQLCALHQAAPEAA